ncbi:surface lipoprotein assembly modifier [Sphingomonas sp. NSE70-1]|uniref:Surface lipoprotein assembly modifier n=1 Tax=Sphingomonas caseinilyticus TaxID=2908205 RepID=A0ABT0RSN4_9SPHN|nr:surface lipoprotein assembly modifier [Sphingomonas caseinilyticus]MCL6698005.1 surface lipoprotein assembly modifier [Sphingomonas caseinilyticus]
MLAGADVCLLIVAMQLSASGEQLILPKQYSQAPPRQNIQLNSGQMLALAAQAQERGDIATAQAAYRALAEDPNPEVRIEAMFRHGKLMVQSGRPREGATLLRKVVDARPEAIAARLELARTLDLLGDKDGAWREVRAVQAKGLPIEVARLVDRYSEALRAVRPAGASFEIAIAPDTNINRSTNSNTLETVLGDFDIQEDSKATSGMGVALDGQVYRRFGIGGGSHNLLLRLSGAADLYKKSSYADIVLDFAAGPELQFGNNRINLEVAATQRWYGLEPYVRAARFSASLIRPLGRRMQMQLAGSAGVSDNQLNNLQDAKTFFGRAKFERALSPTTGVALNLSGFRNSASDAGYSTTEWRTALLAWKEMGRATFTAEAEFGRLQADERLLLFPSKRSETYYGFTLGATFRQVQLGGFAPITRIRFERNQSTIEFYDYKRTRAEFGVTRAF